MTPTRSMPGPDAPATLELSELTVRFGGVYAVERLTLSHAEGGVVGLIGPNGAGKTTVLNVLSGAFRATSGQVRLNRHDIGREPPHRIAQLGIARTFQNLQTFKSLTVLENVLVPLETRAARGPYVGLLAPLLNGARLRRQAMALLEKVDLDTHAELSAAALPYGAQRRLEVARALANDPRLLMLDEPLAGLSRVESDELAEVIRSVANAGITVLLVEHDMVAVMQISDRVAVLDHGRLIADGDPAEVQSDERVKAAYLGDGSIGGGRETPRGGQDHDDPPTGEQDRHQAWPGERGRDGSRAEERGPAGGRHE